MNLEKEINCLKWYQNGNLRIRIRTGVDISVVWVTLDEYNICLKLGMFEFVEKVKEELLIDATINREWNGYRGFAISSENTIEFIEYIAEFIVEWDIKVTAKTVSKSDIIAHDIWYSLT